MLEREPSAVDMAAADCPDTPPIESLKLAPLPLLSPLSSNLSIGEQLMKSSQNLSMELLPTVASGGPRSMEVAISFDTTGSMSQCLEQVQAQVNQMIERLFMDIPDLKIAVIAHGDYCDEEHFYVTQHVDFTNQLPTLATFVKDVGGTGGGDWEECYEYVLNLARTKLSWTPGTQRALVMIGDAAPHAPGTEASRGYDWRVEVGQLNREMGVSVYGVQCLHEDRATPFWTELAESTGGRHLQLGQVASAVDMIMAIVYREHGAGFFDAYEQEVRARDGEGLRRDLNDMFHRLRHDDQAVTREEDGGKDGNPMKRARKAAKVEPKVKKPKVEKPKVEPKVKKPKVEPKAKKPKAAKAEPKPKKLKVRKTLKSKKPARESVHQSHFALSSLNWSPWRKAMTTVAPNDGCQWLPRTANQPGFRNASLFTDSKRSKLTVYEFAVQTGANRKMHVVFFRCSSGIPTGTRWDRHLLHGAGIQSLVTKALQQRTAGSQVTLMARRALLPDSGVVRVEGKQHTGARGLAGLLKVRYDYAWRPCKQRTERTRRLEKNGCVLSQ